MRYRPVKHSSKAAKRQLASRILKLPAALLLLAGLQSCSAINDPTWPTLAKIVEPTDAMTTEQRQKALQDIQKNAPAQSTPSTKPAGQ